MREYRIAVIGLGYVGLPLAIELSRKFKTIGFDVNETRISELCSGIDRTLEVSSDDLSSTELQFSKDENSLESANVFIVTVPTPIDENKKPDLSHLEKATHLVSKFVKKGDLIIYESTVYPGVTEDYCGKIIEKESKLKLNEGFSLGYSPERINPGDKEKKLTDILKIISASNSEALIDLNNIYGSIIKAGLYRAENIKTAEAAKVIENTQRDVNIGLINELSKIFTKLEIDTEAVLEAADTKWNFIRFKPGLVGGHCIGVDPYYLAHIARENDVEPKVILSARETNDHMASHCAELIQSKLLANKTSTAKILIMGATFKENCPDFRNSKVIDLYRRLYEFDHDIHISDDNIDGDDFYNEHQILLKNKLEGLYDVIIIAVSHQKYIDLGESYFRSMLNEKGFIFDLKSIFAKNPKNIRI